jgi:predicted methyltransferase
VNAPFVQPAPAQSGGRSQEKDTPLIGMQKLKVKTKVCATITGCGTLTAVITKVILDKETNIYWYDVEFEDMDVKRLKQGVMNRAGKPAKKNEIVPVPPRVN